MDLEPSLAPARREDTTLLRDHQEALERAGASLSDIVRTRVILTDIENWRGATEVRRAFCRNARPVDTSMAIDRFVNPEWLVEIEVEAIVTDRGSETSE